MIGRALTFVRIGAISVAVIAAVALTAPRTKAAPGATITMVSPPSSARQLPSTWTELTDASRLLADLIGEARRAASADAFWVGYTFALRDGVRIGCDDRRGRTISFGSDGARLYLDDEEPGGAPCDGDFGLFLRIEADGEADGDAAVDARLMSWRRATRRLDGEVVWAGAFVADDSAAWLRSAVLDDGADGLQVSGRAAERTRRRLLSAVAVHDSADAITTVLAALNPAYPSELRESAVFWTAQFGGQDGLAELLALARADADTEVRKQSVFWLAQVAGERVTQDLAAIAADDAETEVQTSAVFALSQIDDDGAIDELIAIVRTHDDAEVVKSALFWLGQSGDPRAVALIEEILFGRGR